MNRITELTHRIPSGFFLAGIMLAATLIRLFQIGRESLWYDELYAVWASKLPLGELFGEALASRHPPLYYVANHIVYLFGSGEFWLRSISICAGVASVGIAYLIGCELYSRRAGLWGGAFVAISPMLVWYSREATSYALLTSLALASLLFLIRSIKHGGWLNWSGFAITICLALATHFFAVVLLPASLLFWYLVAEERRLQAKSALLIAGITVAAGLATMAAVAGTTSTLLERASPGTFFFKFLDSIIDSPAVLLGGPDIYETLGNKQLAKVVFFVALPTAFFAAALFSERLRDRVRERRSLALLAYTAALLAGPVFLYALLDDVTASYRFFSWAATSLLLFAAAIIAGASARARYIAGAVIIILLGLMLFPVLTEEKWDMRAVVNTIDERQRSGDVILCFPIHHCVVAGGTYVDNLPVIKGGYYVDGVPRFLPADAGWHGYANPGMEIESDSGPVDLDALVAQQQELLSGFDRVWLVAGDGNAATYPSPIIVEQMLAQGWVQRGVWLFPPIMLKLYERRQEQPAVS